MIATLGCFTYALSGCAPPAPPVVPLRSLPQLPLVALRAHRSGQIFNYAFTTLDNQADPTFNRLLGINNLGKISGYYGSGATGHPNRGYVVYRPYGPNNFRNENYPGASDTQVTSLNNKRTIAGLYVARHGAIFGFVQTKGIWSSYKDPHLRKGDGSVTELLGLSDSGLAVGFYTATSGASFNQGFELDEPSGKFHNINPPGAKSAAASGINTKGDIVGFLTRSDDHVAGFLLKGGLFTEFSYPRATATQALGVNYQDQIAGTYVDRSGASHGFVLTNPLSKDPTWQSIDDPNGKGKTVVTSINNHHDLVGYYVDRYGNTDGFLAVPK
ncbi:MAG: hypothetical protein WA814_02335 [Candidatus Baltobacteraceae bacterium]